MAVRESGKTRSQRIDLDYYRKPTWLTRLRWIFALIALVLSGTYAYFVLASGGGAHVSRGPLAAAHASFESDCAACHQGFIPLATDAKWLVTHTSLEQNEQACRQCHQDTTNHFRTSLTPEHARIDQQCSGCHRDHQGRGSLIPVSQQVCTQCHSELDQTVASPGSLAIRASVAAFTKEAHGDFASLQVEDPGRIQFNHALHMMPGQVHSDRRGTMTLAMIEPSKREAYRKVVDGTLQSDDAVVTLACADCHQMAGVPERISSADDEIGRHMESISFDRHCVACHAINPAGRTDETLPLPHGAPWAEIELLLTSKLIGGRHIGTIATPRQRVRSTPLVGEGEHGGALVEPEDDTAALVSSTLAATRQQCLKCHIEDDITDEAIRARHLHNQGPLIPPRWLRRGLYDHAAHRRIDCVYCHREAYPEHSSGEANEGEARSIVMIGGIETCTDCHRGVGAATPSALVSSEMAEILGGQSTWASDNCATCHRYHWQRGDWTKLEAALSRREPAP
jgi:hypothetical protein